MIRTALGCMVLVGLISCSHPVSPAGEQSPAPMAALPTLGAVADFQLTDQTGQPFGSAQLRGHIWIANFIFTRCPEVCPRFSAQMATLQKHTAAQGSALQLISFSVDPDYDTPARLAEYGKSFGADSTRWRFLTGPLERVRRTVVDALKVAMEGKVSDRDANGLLHGTRFVLVDRGGMIRGYYASDDSEALVRLERDATSLALQPLSRTSAVSTHQG